MSFGAHGKNSDPRTNKYMIRFYLCFYGGFLAGLAINPIIGAAIALYGIYCFIVCTFTDRP